MGCEGGEKRKQRDAEGEARIWGGGKGKKERMEEGRKKATEEGERQGRWGGEGQREQGSLTGGHSGQGGHVSDAR